MVSLISDQVHIPLFYKHTIPCKLLNANSCSYIYIKCIGFGLVWFYGISNIVGYLIAHPVYKYILNIYDLVWLGFMPYQPLELI